MNIIRKNIWWSFLLCVIALAGIFRFSPYLFPISKADIARERFHSVKFYDRHGNLLQEVLSQDAFRSLHVDLGQVSPYFLEAIIAAEDKNFYRHSGVDYAAVLRALWQNLRSGEVVSGASTITLQLARLLEPAQRTLPNKLRETYRAFRLEAGMDKEALLEEYLNRLPMGGNLYGVESASRAYFGVPASELTLAQAALLASIPNSPNRFNPYHGLAELKKRQGKVLEQMAVLGMIPAGRVKRVLKEDVLLKPPSASFLAPHLVFQLMETLPADAQSVNTTIDIQLQKMVQEQIKRVLGQLKPYHVSNAAAILVNNHSGEVLAYVGSADYFDAGIQGQNDGVRALRQPGSALKPFMYLLAMEQGFNPASLLSDIPTHYRMLTGIYSPQNYSEDFHGPVRLREALANSLNVPAVRVLAKIGIDAFLERLREYGFHSLDKDAEHYGVGLVLGNGEVTLYELTRAYLAQARRGNFLPLRETLSVNGKESRPGLAAKTISTPALNYLIADILSDHFARAAEFGFNSVLNLPFPCSVKTGTSFRFCDNWTVGFTQDYTLGVWVGNFDHTPMLKVSGVAGAGPIFANIMMMLYRDKEYPEKPSQPEGLAPVQICPFSGKKTGEFCPTLVEELIPERDLPAFQSNPCDMHLHAGEQIAPVVPAKYLAWSEKMGMDSRTIHPQNTPVFEIVNPKDGSVYYRLSTLQLDYQSIRFQLNFSETDQPVNWFLNGKPLRSTEKDHTFLWPLQPGKFVLEAVSGKDKGLRSRVKFEVK